MRIFEISFNFPIIRHEPRHNKTNKMSVRPAQTQISLGIRPVWSVSSMCTEWVAKDPNFLQADYEDWSDWAGCPGWSESSLFAQPFCWFCRVAAHIRNIENHCLCDKMSESSDAVEIFDPLMCIKLRLPLCKFSIENVFYFWVELLTCVVEFIISHSSIILSILIIAIFQQSL